jgi:hypothetical protein
MRLVVFMAMLLMTFGRHADAQEWNTTIPKDIVILQSTKNYTAALTTAREAAARLGKKLEMEDNHPNKVLGLSMSREDCTGNGYDFPCYTARGDGNTEDSDFISVEYSNAYEGFAKGYYIVVAGIGDPGAASVKQTLANARKWYKDAYAKRTKVWHGCMH